MARRVFIFSNEKFPRGSAGANYIEYLALALKSLDWEVIVLGIGEGRDEDRIGDKYIYNGIEYFNDPIKRNQIVRIYGNPTYIKEVQNRYTILEDDFAVVYSTDSLLIKRVRKLFEPEKITCVRVEDIQSYQYKGRALNPRYILYRTAIYQIQHIVRKSMPISTSLEEQDRKNGAETLRVPIMANPYEFEYSDKNKGQVIRFIYPGMKLNNNEDMPDVMIKAINDCVCDSDNRIELHITGIKKERFDEWATQNKVILSENIVLHEWMEYVDLVELYKQMDFLILARKDNATTRGNFPSKVPELMSFGVIPVCSDVGDYTKYYLEDGVNSIIFQPDSFEDCKAAVRRACMLSEEQYSNMRRSARQLVEDKFYYGNWAQQINDFLLEE